jgi:phosphoserine aminotransferase
MTRVHNFSPGPAAIPLPALERARDEMLDFAGSGMSIMEMSHRGKVYDAVHQEALDLVRRLMQVPAEYDILFLQGGATQQFAQIPLNFRGPEQSADYIVAGAFGKKAFKEAAHTGRARLAVSTEIAGGKFHRVPEARECEFDPAAAYVHMTSNNTIMGTESRTFPETGSVPLMVDMSSDIMGVEVDVSKCALIYAGAQKNLGPSGVTLVIARRELIDAGRTDIPFIWQYRTQRDERSLANTAPTFGIYMLRNTLAWLEQMGGVPWAAAENRKKADLLYRTLEKRPDLYHLSVEPASRSVMNVVWNLPTEEMSTECVRRATSAGLVGLKGHRVVGGLRASLYNAVSMESVQALVAFLDSYEP